MHKHSHGVIGIFGEEAQIHDKEVSDNQYGVKSLLEQEYPMEIMNLDSISTLLEHRLITLMLQEMLQKLSSVERDVLSLIRKKVLKEVNLHKNSIKQK